MTITWRDFTGGGLALSCFLAASANAPMAFAGDAGLAERTAKAARTLVAALSPGARAKAVLPFDSAHRRDWHYTPRSRQGVTLNEMSDGARAALWDFLGETLSMRGIAQVRGVIAVERILGELTDNLAYRDPGDYAIVLFGDPQGADVFAWRFEGHHLSISALVAEGHGVAVTPVFIGANPATVPGGHDHAGFRLLGDEEDRAFGLVRSIEGEARSRAIISDRSLGNIVAGPSREVALKQVEGVPLSQLSEGQRDGVFAILDLYVGMMHDEIARAATSRVREDGASRLHFAWAGSLEPGRPHYFRIHGPSVLVEYDNTRNGANHVHSVWIDPDRVFGRDFLAQHHRQDHTSD